MATIPFPTNPIGSTESIPTRRPIRLLGVWAHPDDEAYLSAGLMARVIQAGGQVTVLTATLGELGFPDDDTRSLADKAGQRDAEMRAAMAEIGVHDVRFMRWADGEVADVPIHLATRRIASVIHDVQPDLIVTFGPDGITGHPDHVAISRAATAAWRSTGIGELLYATSTTTWLADFREMHERLGVFMGAEPQGTDPDDLALHVELSSSELARKRQVLARHASQTVGIADAMGEDVYLAWSRDEFFRAPTAADLNALSPSAMPEDDYLWSAAWLELTRDLAPVA